jgi:cell division protein FtsL
MSDHQFHVALATIGTAIFLILLCGVILIAAALRDEWILHSEQRAIARRDADEAKRQADAEKWNFLTAPRSDRMTRIAHSEIDPAYRSGMFAIPHSMRDMKGTDR